MARQGYGGGDPQRVMRMPTDIVMAALEYETFLSDYEMAYYDLNKNG